MDELFMREAIAEAQQGAVQGEVPVGAVLVLNGEIIARGHNRVETDRTVLSHAELLCLKQGSHLLGNWRLLEATLYCTLEPCPMCAGAMIHSRLKRLVWGAPDLRCGANGSWVDLWSSVHPIHRVEVTARVLEAECAELMRSFFRQRR